MKWTDEDREEFCEQIADGMIAQMTLEDIRQCVWDLIYEDLIYQEWADLIMQAQEYAPELLEVG
jgi:hypothetical protein